MVLEIFFFIALGGIVHTYLFYPLFMRLLSLFSKETPTVQIPREDLPTVEIIFAAYNEEAVIRQKIESSFNSDYPAEKLSLRVGSDNSSDSTNDIITKLESQYPALHFEVFEKRTGKSGIINKLIKKSSADLLILTDANIIFTSDTIPELVNKLMADKAGACGGTIIYGQLPQKGIARQENTYLNMENRLKLAESMVFKNVMGLEGGCYIIKRELFPQIPPLYFMEDFFVSLHVLKLKEKVIFSEKAICYEDVSIHGKEEFKRKIRISIGNFQNLNHYKRLILSRFFPLGFAFLSHKILRWLTPFFMIALLVLGLLLIPAAQFYFLFILFYLFFLLLGILGALFSQEKWAGWLRYPGHFLHMNLALLKGFFIYLKGVKNNAWQPTRRNQK